MGMRFGEQVLLLLSSRKEDTASWEPKSTASALEPLQKVFPNLEQTIVGKKVVEFGCGNGWQAVALAKLGAIKVVGLDTNPRCLANARRLANELAVTDRTDFTDSLDERPMGSFDVAISKDSMEHFADPAGALEQMKQAVKTGGKIMITFGPPWLAPYGSHTQFFTRVPWVPLLFSEDTVMRVRLRFRQDGALRYEDVEGGLNRMTVRRFERLVRDSALRTVYARYDCVKRLNFLRHVPLLRELSINQVSVILTSNQTERTGE